MNATTLPNSEQLDKRIAACEEELRELRRLRRMVRAAELADDARRRRQANQRQGVSSASR